MMHIPNRRTFLKTSLLSSTFGLFPITTYASIPTPREIEGPFYPVLAQKDKDFDLTKIQGREGVAEGEVAIIEGRVLDTAYQPIEGAIVDLWQANAAGRYRHPRDSSKTPLDPNFQGWAILQSGKGGAFRFKTIVPGAYPVSSSWTRPPHIHFKAGKQGYKEVVTQMYFPDHALNQSDRLLMQKTPQERALMTARKTDSQPGLLRYDLILAPNNSKILQP